MRMFTVELRLQDLEAATPEEAAAMFLAAMMTADWSAGLTLQVHWEDDSNTYQSETVTLDVDDVERALRK